MAKLIEEIIIPEKFRTTSTCSPTVIRIFDEYTEVEGPRASTYFYKDFTGISTQNASILCAYASIIFLNAVSANSTWKNDAPILTDRNRLLLCGGSFKYKDVNIYATEVADKIRKAFDNYKKGNVDIKPVDAIDEIKRYKELLDIGAITQEEFDKKKRQLLEL